MDGYHTKYSAIKIYKKEAIEAAKDLCYSDDILKKLNKAKSVGEIERIMYSARKKEK